MVKALMHALAWYVDGAMLPAGIPDKSDMSGGTVMPRLRHRYCGARARSRYCSRPRRSGALPHIAVSMYEGHRVSRNTPTKRVEEADGDGPSGPAIKRWLQTPRTKFLTVPVLPPR